MVISPDFANRRFRRNYKYEVVGEGQLSAAERERFADVKDDPGFAALLRPEPGSLLNYRAAGPELVDLLQALQEATSLPDAVVAGDDRDAAIRQVALLALDGVLEVESDAGFVSGPSALTVVGAIGDPVEPGSALGRLSLAALRYGEALRFTSPRLLANRLYAYNWEPISSAQEALLPDEQAVRRLLGLGGDGEQYGKLQSGWNGPDLRNRWFNFIRREGRVRIKPTEPMFKLYVSPKLEALAFAFDEVIGTLEASAVNKFKVGADLQGVVRPDKLVLYFADRQAVDEMAAALLPRLADVPAHGVPFTAPLDDIGILSWGMDPPRRDRTPGDGPSSWRLWVVERLATALVQGSAEPAAEIPAWRFAIERLGLEGIDVADWRPDPSLWNNGGAS